MKKMFKKINQSGLLLFAVTLILGAFGIIDASAMCADAVYTNAANSVTTLTQDDIDLLHNQVDDMVVKVRPMATPWDAASRHFKQIHLKNMQYDTWSIGTLGRDAVTTAAVTTGAQKTLTMSAADAKKFSIADTITVPSILIDGGTVVTTATSTSRPLVLYVVKKDNTANNSPIVIVAPGTGIGTDKDQIPAIASGTAIKRKGKSITEYDIAIEPYKATPSPTTQYAQKFGCEIHETTLFQKSGNKEVKWSLTDQAEEAIYDMKVGIEIDTLFGVKSKGIVSTFKGDQESLIWTTEGAWWQAGKDYDFNGIAPSNANIPQCMRTIFTGNGSGKRKLLFSGSGFIEAFEATDYFSRNVNEGSMSQAWGIEFSRIVSRFGVLEVVLSEVFDLAGYTNCGLVIDPTYAKKGTFGLDINIPDLRKANEADMAAKSFREICFILLQNPNAHCRLYLDK